MSETVARMYVVTDSGGYDGEDRAESIYGVFSTRDAADACAKRVSAPMYEGFARVSEWVLDVAREP